MTQRFRVGQMLAQKFAKLGHARPLYRNSDKADSRWLRLQNVSELGESLVYSD